jgi:DNA polymerase I
MELELRPPLSLPPATFNVLIAPEEVLIDSFNDHLGLQRIEVLYICGNYSRILDELDRRFTDLDVRRGFTSHQILTILKEAYQTLIIFEHDPSLFEGASEMAEYVGRGLKEASRGSAVLLYTPRTDPSIDEIAKFADRVMVFNEVLKRVYKRASKEVKPGPKVQRTLEAF